MLHVRLAEISDIPELYNHTCRHFAESGRDGDFIFAPYEGSRNIEREDAEMRNRERWARPVTERLWERVWILTDEKEIYGEASLMHSPPLPTSLHRSWLSMGIERPYRGQGYGPKLLQAVIDWAKAQPTLDWIQLQVFETNLPAKKLYKKFGFVECGTVPDLFRIYGNKVDDTTMVLKIR